MKKLLIISMLSMALLSTAGCTPIYGLNGDNSALYINELYRDAVVISLLDNFEFPLNYAEKASDY